MGESEEELKSLLMKVKEESEKVGFKAFSFRKHSENKDQGIWSHHSWQIVEKPWKQWQTLIIWAPKSLQMVIAAMELKDTYSLEGKL